MGTLDELNRLIEGETWTSRRTGIHPPEPDDETEFLEQSIRLSAARCSMASWGLPFEAIASAWLLGLIDKKR